MNEKGCLSSEDYYNLLNKKYNFWKRTSKVLYGLGYFTIFFGNCLTMALVLSGGRLRWFCLTASITLIFLSLAHIAHLRERHIKDDIYFTFLDTGMDCIDDEE